MPEIEADQLKQAVEKMHGGTATLAQSVPVRETFEGKTVWNGVVHIFDLAGHPTATRAYAWPFPAEGSDQLRIVAGTAASAEVVALPSRTGDAAR